MSALAKAYSSLRHWNSRLAETPSFLARARRSCRVRRSA